MQMSGSQKRRAIARFVRDTLPLPGQLWPQLGVLCGISRLSLDDMINAIRVSSQVFNNASSLNAQMAIFNRLLRIIRYINVSVSSKRAPVDKTEREAAKKCSPIFQFC